MNNRQHKVEENLVRVFKLCKKPSRPPDSLSWQGSRYWYGENKRGKYMIRASDHWGKVGSSLYLFIKQVTKDCHFGKEKVGKTYLTVNSFTV